MIRSINASYIHKTLDQRKFKQQYLLFQFDFPICFCSGLSDLNPMFFFVKCKHYNVLFKSMLGFHLSLIPRLSLWIICNRVFHFVVTNWIPTWHWPWYFELRSKFAYQLNTSCMVRIILHSFISTNLTHLQMFFFLFTPKSLLSSTLIIVIAVSVEPHRMTATMFTSLT